MNTFNFQNAAVGCFGVLMICMVAGLFGFIGIVMALLVGHAVWQAWQMTGTTVHILILAVVLLMIVGGVFAGYEEDDLWRMK